MSTGIYTEEVLKPAAFTVSCQKKCNSVLSSVLFQSSCSQLRLSFVIVVLHNLNAFRRYFSKITPVLFHYPKSYPTIFFWKEWKETFVLYGAQSLSCHKNKRRTSIFKALNIFFITKLLFYFFHWVKWMNIIEHTE